MMKQYDLQWTARRDRRLIGTRGGKRHVLINVHAPRVERNESNRRPPLNLGLVIDASGSMSGEPLEAAIQAACGVVEKLCKRDRLTVVSFADDVVVHAERVRCNEEGRSQAIAAIRQLQTRGCTNLAGGWLEGCELVAAAIGRKAGVQHRVILLSDGYANRGICDAAELGHHAGELRRRGLYTSCVGIGDHYSPTQLQAIAEHGGGRLHDAPVGKDIVAVVLGELGEILDTAADDLRVVVRHPRRVGVTVLGPYGTEVRDQELVVNLGTLVAGASRQVVLQVGVPGGTVGERFEVEVLPEWIGAEDGLRVNGKVLRGEFALVPDSEMAAEVPDMETGVTVARLWQKQVLLESTMLNTEGRCDEARRLVQEVLPEFRAYCRELPGAGVLVREMEEHGEEVSVVMESREARFCLIDASMALRSERDFRASTRGETQA